MNYLILIVALILVGLLVFACYPKKKKADVSEVEIKTFKAQYDFETPTQRLILPKSLKEISGLSFYKDNQLACVNDEQGKVFIYDLEKEEVIDKISIGKKGDYEGIEVVDNEIFILKSNGKIKGFKIGEEEERKIDCMHPDVVEYEGLSYNPKTKSLLLAAKELVKDKDGEKVIYAYSFEDETLSRSIVISKDTVRGIDGKTEFRASGIAVHPISGEIYVIASQGKKLLILSVAGIKEALIELDDELFRQPEGICFTPNGDLYISSEGAGDEGYILKFGYKK